MIVHDALRSMRKDPGRCFFFWLTFLVSTMVIFLFVNITASDPEDGAALGSFTVSAGILFLVLLVCSVDIFFANDFYVKSKAKEMAVRLICGATFFQIASFLLIQTTILLILALPAGLLLSFASLHPLNWFFHAVMGASLTIRIHRNAVLQAGGIVLYILGWTVMLNLSFAYRNAAGMMMNQGALSAGVSGSFFKTGLISDKTKGRAGLVIYLLAIVSFYTEPAAAVMSSLVGLAGLALYVKNCLPSRMEKKVQKDLTDPVRLAADGFIRRDLQVLRRNVFLYAGTSCLLTAEMLSHAAEPSKMVMLLVCYVFLTFLQSMSLMFRLASSLSGRKKNFATLASMGYVLPQLRKIISREIRTVYRTLAFCALLYLLNILLEGILMKAFSLPLALILAAVMIVPLLIWMEVTRIYYEKTALPQ